MIVTIDGPAGSGKSSAAKGLAARLGFEVLDTGAMYRAVALAALRSGALARGPEAVSQLLPELRIEMPPGRILLNGEDVSGAICTPEVAQAASRVAALLDVRRFLVESQRAIAAGRDMVCEGRDQGTVVFPHAVQKFFLKADPVERARRRLAELPPSNATLDDVLAEQRVRDERDASRDLAPMIPAADAIVIDTTHLTPDEVLDRLEREVRPCLRD